MASHWSLERDMIPIIQQTIRLLDKNPQSKDRVEIAVLDSGINPFHPCVKGFKAFPVKANDCVNEPGPRYCEDRHGHGTFVTGIICNILKKVKRRIKIHVIKILNWENRLEFSHLKKAYDLFKKDPLKNVFLLCQSAGFDKIPDSGYNLKNKITGKRTLICAASNDGEWSTSNIAWPANEAVAVGSCDEYGKRSRLSPQGAKLWVLAPGENILSAHYQFDEDRPEDPEHPVGPVRRDSGTSYAAPWVTALLALFHLQLPLRYPGNI